MAGSRANELTKGYSHGTESLGILSKWWAELLPAQCRTEGNVASRVSELLFGLWL